MTLQIQVIIFGIFIQNGLTDFDCTEQENLPTCSSELSCYYDEGYEQLEGHSKFCRCKTVISDLPLPRNFLTYSMFKSICSRDEAKLQQLWITDASLEYIDSEIFEKYPNLTYVNLAGNEIRLNFSEKAERITALDISNNELRTIKTDDLSNLKSLKMINISFNALDGVNFCFEKLNNLEEIYLNNNKLRQIAKEFDHLYELKVLNLAYNFLTTVESHLFLRQLRELYLNNNKLRSINKHEFIQLPNLKILKIGDNYFTRFVDHYSFEKLEELHCENNQISDVNKNVLGKLSNLKFLNISNNDVKTLEAETFSSRNSLEVVDISSNKLENVDRDTFQSFKNVTFLNFNNNSLTESVINCDNLQHLGRLKVLHLFHNQISEIFNCTFSKLVNLSKLTLLANQLEKIPPSAFNALTKLEELNLADNQITDFPEGIFDELKQLRKLNISHNNLTKFNLNSLNLNQKIVSFDIKNNHLENFDLNLLQNKLPSLKYFDLDANLVECDLYGEVLKHFDENNVMFETCSGDKCCIRRGFSAKTVVFIVGGVLICIFAIIGLVACWVKVCKSKKKNDFLVILQSQK